MKLIYCTLLDSMSIPNAGDTNDEDFEIQSPNVSLNIYLPVMLPVRNGVIMCNKSSFTIFGFSLLQY